jgi:hypothetical protein
LPGPIAPSLAGTALRGNSSMLRLIMTGLRVRQQT